MYQDNGSTHLHSFIIRVRLSFETIDYALHLKSWKTTNTNRNNKLYDDKYYSNQLTYLVWLMMFKWYLNRVNDKKKMLLLIMLKYLCRLCTIVLGIPFLRVNIVQYYDCPKRSDIIILYYFNEFFVSNLSVQKYFCVLIKLYKYTFHFTILSQIIK